MTSNLKWKAVFIAAVILACLIGLVGRPDFPPKSWAGIKSNFGDSIKLGLDLQVTTPVKDQELRVGVTYWEGCIRLAGELAGKPASGVGYMELTGYAGESLR